MLSVDEKKKVLEELSKHRKEVRDLRDSLNKINNEKESWFQKKKEYAQEITRIVSVIKTSKDKRDDLTGSVKKLKADRDELRNQISKRIKEIKNLKSEHSSATKKFPVKKNPKSIKQEIEKLETVIETEIVSFKREQKIMDKIRNLKKVYSEIQSLSGEIEKTDRLSGSIDNLKKEADKVHKYIQIIAAESHKKHETMIEKSKSMKDLKKKEKSAYKQFSYMKKRFGDLNQALRSKLSRLNELSRLLEQTKFEKKEKIKKKEENILKEKTENVEEKIKRGKKLTTEDLLVFQRSNEDK